MQQDSINELHKAFLKTGIRPRFDTAWKIIRELRNLTVGHPIEKKDKDGIKRCFIFQLTIKEANLQLLVWNKSKGKNGRSEFENIQLSSLYEKYKSEAVKILKSICQEQVRIWSALP